jgi:hypothetical protein
LATWNFSATTSAGGNTVLDPSIVMVEAAIRLQGRLSQPGHARLRPRRHAGPPCPDQRPGPGGSRSGQIVRNPKPVEAAPLLQGPALPLPPESCRLPRRPQTARLPTAGFAAEVFSLTSSQCKKAPILSI